MASESPKWIALVLSVLAITISALSWWESHQGRLINEEVNRPILDYSKDFEVAVSPYKDSLSIHVEVSLKNTGKTRAVLDSVKFTIKLRGEAADCLTKDAMNDLLYPSEILPGTQRVISKNMILSRKCEEVAKRFDLALEVTYSDPGAGRTYFQGFGKFAEVPDVAEKPSPSP